MTAKPNQGALILIRKPTKEDGRAMYELVRSCAPPLDLNSEYLYSLVGAHFSETSAVAEQDSAIFGLTSAYILPFRKDRLFVWQIAVHPEKRKKGMARSMLNDILLTRPVCQGIRHLEATVTPSNEASKRLFRGFARRRGLECREETFLDSKSFGDTAHEQEILFTIGPLR